MTRFVYKALGTVAGLAAASSALFLAMPKARPEADRAAVLAVSAECQVLVVGPSYVKEVLPEVFDAEAARVGFDKRACRLGRTNLRGYELEHELDVLLSHRWPKLERVVIDITLGDSLSFDPENWFKPRVIAWHTFRAIPWLHRYYVQHFARESNPITMIAAHAGHIAANYLSLGRAAELFPGGGTTTEPTRKTPKARKGSNRSHQAKLSALKRKKRLITAKHQTTSARWALELRRVVRRHGHEPIFLYSPVWSGLKPPLRVGHGEDPLVLLDFDDPARFPELYTADVRGSTQHLNDRGGHIYSKLLVRELQAIWDEPK